MQDLERMQAVTENYFLWQGLRLVPLGVMGIFLALRLAEPSWWPLRGASEDAILLFVVVAGMGAFSWIGRYYHRSFGEVRGLPGRHSRRDAIKWWVAYPLMGLSPIVDSIIKAPVFLTGVVWAAGVVAFWASTGRGRRHYLVFAVLLAFLTFVPLLGLVPPGKPMLNLFIGTLGAIYVMAGLLDHRELVRVMRPVPEEG